MRLYLWCLQRKRIKIKIQTPLTVAVPIIPCVIVYTGPTSWNPTHSRPLVVVSSGQSSTTAACAPLSVTHHAHGRSAPPCPSLVGVLPPPASRTRCALYALVAAQCAASPLRHIRVGCFCPWNALEQFSSSPAHGQ
ncbi:hypothetical protein VPH35_102332 [Triticum aestivum]